jgi:hypothetical protein
MKVYETASGEFIGYQVMIPAYDKWGRFSGYGHLSPSIDRNGDNIMSTEEFAAARRSIGDRVRALRPPSVPQQEDRARSILADADTSAELLQEGKVVEAYQKLAAAGEALETLDSDIAALRIQQARIRSSVLIGSVAIIVVLGALYLLRRRRTARAQAL